MEEYSYTSTHPLGHTGRETGSLYLDYLSFCFYIKGIITIRKMHGVESFRIEWNRGTGALAVEYPYQSVCTTSLSE